MLLQCQTAEGPESVAVSSVLPGATRLAFPPLACQTTMFYLKNSNLCFLNGVGWGDARKIS